MARLKKEVKFKLVDTDYEYDFGVNYRLQLINLSIGKNKFSLVDLYVQQYLRDTFISFKEFLVECLTSELSIRFQIIASKYDFQVFALKLGLSTLFGDIQLTLFKYDRVTEQEKWQQEALDKFANPITPGNFSIE